MSEKKREPDYRPEVKLTVRNDFVTADYPIDITATDLKILRMVIAQCRKNDTEFMEYDFSAVDLAEKFNMDKSNLYRVARACVKRLFKCDLTVGDDKKFEMLHIFRTVKYEDGRFTMRLSEEVEKLFLQLNRDFTNMPLLPILAMRNKNSIRIYELICQKCMGHYPFADHVTEITITTEELRKVTETLNTKSYDHVGHLKSRVLVPSIMEIEKSASWKIFCNDLKKSRKVIGFRLEIWNRNGWEYVEDCKRKGIIPKQNDQIKGQTSIFDFGFTMPEDES